MIITGTFLQNGIAEGGFEGVDVFKIEKILKTKTCRHRYCVKGLSLPFKFNPRVNADDVQVYT